MARAKKEISRVSVSTNGLRVATDYAFCEELRSARLRQPAARRAQQPALRVLARRRRLSAPPRRRRSDNLERAG
jgi:hypothetical protein